MEKATPAKPEFGVHMMDVTFEALASPTGKMAHIVRPLFVEFPTELHDSLAAHIALAVTCDIGLAMLAKVTPTVLTSYLQAQLTASKVLLVDNTNMEDEEFNALCKAVSTFMSANTTELFGPAPAFAKKEEVVDQAAPLSTAAFDAPQSVH